MPETTSLTVWWGKKNWYYHLCIRKRKNGINFWPFCYFWSLCNHENEHQKQKTGMKPFSVSRRFHINFLIKKKYIEWGKLKRKKNAESLLSVKYLPHHPNNNKCYLHTELIIKYCLKWGEGWEWRTSSRKKEKNGWLSDVRKMFKWEWIRISKKGKQFCC